MLSFNQFLSEGALYTHYEPAAIIANNYKQELERNGHRIMGHSVSKDTDGNETHRILTKGPTGKNLVHFISDLSADDKEYAKIKGAESIRRTHNATAHDVKELQGKKA